MLVCTAVSKEARKSLEAAEDVRAAASDAVKNTMEKGVTGALTDEAHMNLKSDEAMRRERIQAQQVGLLLSMPTVNLRNLSR